MRGLTDVTDAVLPHAAAISDALSRNAVYADFFSAMTTGEAVMTQIYEAQTRLVWHLAGQTTPAERRERHEHAARRRELVRTGRTDATPRGRRPQVFWHEAGAGPVLLLLNGWTASGLAWPGAWLRALERSFRVVRIDNRGTGFSRTAPAPYTMKDLADDAVDVLGAIGAENATVLGSSMGGMVAQELAIRRPDLVKRLILVATRPPAPAHIAARSPAMLELLRRPARDEPREPFLRRAWASQCAPGFAEREPERLDELVGQITMRVTPRAGVLNQLRAIAGWHGSERLRRIGVPTVVVHGDADPLVPVGNGMRLAQLIPGARYVELPGVGHLPALEASESLELLLR